MQTNLIKSLLVSGFLVLSACAPSQEQANQINTNGTAIMGGDLVKFTDRAAFSTVGLIAQIEMKDGKREGFSCTGSILEASYVVTAAHCIPEVTADVKKAELYVVFGLDQSKPSRQNARLVVGTVVHPQYNSNAKRTEEMHDIALVKYDGTTPVGYGAASLLTDYSKLVPKMNILVAGYGVNQTDGVNKKNDYKLYQTRLEMLGAMNDTELVLKQYPGKGVCHGDSGGPAFVEESNGKLLLWGITSRVSGTNNIDDCAQLSFFTAIGPYMEDFVLPAYKSLSAGPQK